jgi:hypothetical protein
MYISKARYTCPHFRLIRLDIWRILGYLIRMCIAVKWRSSLANFICYGLRFTMLGWCVVLEYGVHAYGNAPASSSINILAWTDVDYSANKIYFLCTFFWLHYDFLWWLGLLWVPRRGKSLFLKQFLKREIFISVSGEVKIIVIISLSTFVFIFPFCAGQICLVHA